MKVLYSLVLLFAVVGLFGVVKADAVTSFSELEAMIGKTDALLLMTSDGKHLVSKNSNIPLVPASTIKVLTSLGALHYLGEDYRFPVKFYLRDNRDLVIEGFGDPLLVSQVIEKYCSDVAQLLSERKIGAIGNIITDDSYFSSDLSIPGATAGSSQPYDAPTGALSVNFNSVSFKKVSGRIASSEPETPLTSTAENVAEKSGMKQGRIPLPNDRKIINRHSGEIFRYFLSRSGVRITGDIVAGTKSSKDILVYTAYSPYTLKEAVSRLLEFSSNFMANQVFLSVAAKYSEKPATLSDGVLAVKKFAAKELGTDDFVLVEGSGLSRLNRISAEQMSRVLDAFYPFHTLMKSKNGMYYKTGTLDGVSARAGYMESESGDVLRFVIFVNSNGRSAENILGLLKSAVN